MNEVAYVALGAVVGLGAGFVMGLERQGGAACHHLSTELLMRSLFTGISRMTGLLLEKGADPQVRDTGGFTALHHAACFYDGHDIKNPGQRDQDVFAKLAAAGADLSARDNEGFTPLHRAVETGNGYAVARLVQLGADPALPQLAAGGEPGPTAAQLAQAAGREDLLPLLGATGA